MTFLSWDFSLLLLFFDILFSYISVISINSFDLTDVRKHTQLCGWQDGWLFRSHRKTNCATLKINCCISFRAAGAWCHGTHIKRHFQNVLRDLQDAGVAQLAGHTQPGVGRRHCVTKLLDGNDYSPVWNHLGCKKNKKLQLNSIIQKDRKMNS